MAELIVLREEREVHNDLQYAKRVPVSGRVIAVFTHTPICN
jgi:hypothetical protein